MVREVGKIFLAIFPASVTRSWTGRILLRSATCTSGTIDPAANPTSLYAEGGLFNFSYVRIQRQPDGKVHLLADVRDSGGVPRPGSQLDLTPE
jgi:hypothetical protein